MLAGCDYVSSIQGVGIMKALKLVIDFKNVDETKRLLKIARHLRTWKSKVKRPNPYILLVHLYICIDKYYVLSTNREYIYIYIDDR